MRRGLFSLMAALGLALSAVSAGARPIRIMSMNMCTDELLLDLVSKERITSVTYLSRYPSNSYLWPEAAKVGINHGLAEEVLAENPDLVLAGLYTAPAARLLLKKIGAPLVEVPPADNFEQIRAVTRQVAQAVGEVDRGEKLIAKMDATLKDLAATAPAQKIVVAGWNGGGGIPGKGTLFDAILTAAGGVNIAATTEGTQDGRFDIEQLLMARPDVLVYGADSAGRPGLRTDADQHPLLLKLYGNRRISYPEALYSCGVPESADAARSLRESLLDVMKNPGGAL